MNTRGSIRKASQLKLLVSEASTFTTLGFGDVTSNGLFGEILVFSEMIFGYFTLGFLLAIHANTIARRS